MDRHAILYYQSALALKLRCKVEEHIDGFSFFFAKKRYFICFSYTPFNVGSSDSVSRNKYCVNKLLKDAGIPVPDAFYITKRQFADNQIDLGSLNYPVVVKPSIDGAYGYDVFCNIKDEKTLYAYLKKMFEKGYYQISIEKFESHLNSYRILVSQNKVIDVIQQLPAHVIGDGIHTVNELVSMTNKERELKRAKGEMTPGIIKIEEEHHVKLSEIGIALTDIPQKDQRIVLCYKPNSAIGGTMKCAVNKICRENMKLAIKAANTLGLDYVGFDLICEDISKPIGPTRGFFIEANYAPGIELHERRMDGVHNCVSRKALLGFLKKRHPIAFFLHRIKNFLR